MGNLHVREGDGFTIQLQYMGLEGGVGVGLSILGPIGASFSLASFQGGGIGRIYKGPNAGARLSINDMIGPFYMLTFRMNTAPAGFDVSVVFLGLPGPAVGSAVPAMILLAKAAGVVWGVCGSSSGGFEATGTTGMVLAAYAGGLEVRGD
jgi:hypothetical protein